MSVDLTTTYLGMKLANPLVISACPLTAEIEQLRRVEQAGAAAAVLPSLFEEQIEHDAEEMIKVHEFHTDSFAESLTYFPDPEGLSHGARRIPGEDHPRRRPSRFRLSPVSTAPAGAAGWRMQK